MFSDAASECQGLNSAVTSSQALITYIPCELFVWEIDVVSLRLLTNNFQPRKGYRRSCWAQYLLKKLVSLKEKNKPWKLFADFNLRMKMENAVFNFLMETCFQPEEIRGRDLIALNKEGLQGSKCKRGCSARGNNLAIKSATYKRWHTWL